jgi:Family of unknown function (DUF6111)
MGRAVFETLGLFVAPFALFALYLTLRARFPLALEHWTRGRVSLLTVAGLAAAVLGLVFLTLTAPRGQGVYIPAHVEKGLLIQGHFE